MPDQVGEMAGQACDGCSKGNGWLSLVMGLQVRGDGWQAWEVDGLGKRDRQSS